MRAEGHDEVGTWRLPVFLDDNEEAEARSLGLSLSRLKACVVGLENLQDLPSYVCFAVV